MNRLQVGYARVNINPMLGIPVAGYFIPRYASAILDDLESSALALTCGDKKILMISVDSCGINADMVNRYRQRIAEGAGIPAENIFLSATHTHTGPMNVSRGSFPEDVTRLSAMQISSVNVWWMCPSWRWQI